MDEYVLDEEGVDKDHAVQLTTFEKSNYLDKDHGIEISQSDIIFSQDNGIDTSCDAKLLNAI